MDHNCIICNKKYASYKSLWNHTKTFHKNNVDESKPNVNIITSNVNHVSTNVSHNCIICQKIFTTRQAKWKHQKKCTIINDNKLKEENELLKEKLKINEGKTIEFEKEMIEMKKQMMTLMIKVCKIHPKTLTKINKQLNITNNDNKVINNYIIQLGREKLCDVFSKKEKIAVLKQGYNCLPYLIEYTHFNEKYPQFKNILITNTQNNIGYKYNEGNKNFDAITKDELLNDIISERSDDICNFNVEYKECLSAKEQTRIDEVIKKILNSPEFDEEQKKQIKFIIYNNRNKVSKEVTQDLEIVI